MATQKRKFDLFQRLGALGFTYEEAQSLYRIELTLHRWAEEECNGTIQRDDETGKPVRVYDYAGSRRNPIADREAGALKRLAAILTERNLRERGIDASTDAPAMVNYAAPGDVLHYHQGDPRGCALYLCTRAQLTQNGKALPVDQYYNRGLAVCA